MRTTRWAVLSAVVTAAAVVGGCSTGDEPAVEQNEPAQEASQDPSPAAPPSDRDVDGSADQPSDDSTDTATTTEQPSPGFEDVPEGYYVVDNGRAMVAERAGAGCEGMPGLEPRSDDDEHRVHGYWYSQLRDVGPIARATGEAIYDDDGQPVAYVAAPGDTMRAIAARFCIDHYPYLEWINAIRRGDRTSIMDTASMTLYAGDTINLNPYTIATVGDENGVVRDNAIDFHIPPQH